MSKTQQQILIDSAAYLDLDATLPTGDELTTRANYSDRIVREAANTSHLKEFSKVFTSNFSGPTVALPTDFREEESPLYILDSGVWSEWPIIDAKTQYEMNPSDKYAYITGNPSDGHFLHINAMASHSTLSMTYQKRPNGFTTLTDVCELSDEIYVVRKIESYVLESRSDDRFPLVDADAQRRLANMVGRSNKRPPGSGNTTQANFKNPLS